MISLTGDEKVDRLPIIVSCNGVDQLLAVPQLANGTEQAISDAIIHTINEWNLMMTLGSSASGACTPLEAWP